MQLIEDSFNTAIERAESGDSDFKITIEVIDAPEKWVQISWDRINAAYPREQDPEKILEEASITLPKYVDISEWKRNEYVTFEHGAEPLSALTNFVEEYFRKILGVATADAALLHVVKNGSLQ